MYQNALRNDTIPEPTQKPKSPSGHLYRRLAKEHAIVSNEAHRVPLDVPCLRQSIVVRNEPHEKYMTMNTLFSFLRTLLGAPGRTTRNKKLRSGLLASLRTEQDATRGRFMPSLSVSISGITNHRGKVRKSTHDRWPKLWLKLMESRPEHIC